MQTRDILDLEEAIFAQVPYQKPGLLSAWHKEDLKGEKKATLKLISHKKKYARQNEINNHQQYLFMMMLAGLYQSQKQSKVYKNLG